MPEANCPICRCGVSRKLKYQGIGIFKIPRYSEKNKESWRKASLHVVTRDRVVDASFRKQIEEGSVYVCERHFTPEDIEIPKCQSFSYLYSYYNHSFWEFQSWNIRDSWIKSVKNTSLKVMMTLLFFNSCTTLSSIWRELSTQVSENMVQWIFFLEFLFRFLNYFNKIILLIKYNCKYF